MNIKCSFWYESWGPHEGCKEFMDEPEIWYCPELARHVIITMDPDEMSFDDIHMVPTIHFACDEHYEQARHSDMYWEVVHAS